MSGGFRVWRLDGVELKRVGSLAPSIRRSASQLPNLFAGRHVGVLVYGCLQRNRIESSQSVACVVQHHVDVGGQFAQRVDQIDE